MGRPPLVSESPPFLWHLPRAHCLPEVCVWRLQTVCAGQAFYGFHFSDKRMEAHEGGDLPTFHGRV